MSTQPLTILDIVAPRSLLAEHAPGLPVEVLTRKQALVLCLHYVRGEPFERIAAILGISRRAVAALHDRACETIEEELGGVPNVPNVPNVPGFEPE